MAHATSYFHTHRHVPVRTRASRGATSLWQRLAQAVRDLSGPAPSDMSIAFASSFAAVNLPCAGR